MKEITTYAVCCITTAIYYASKIKSCANANPSVSVVWSVKSKKSKKTTIFTDATAALFDMNVFSLLAARVLLAYRSYNSMYVYVKSIEQCLYIRSYIIHNF